VPPVVYSLDEQARALRNQLGTLEYLLIWAEIELASCTQADYQREIDRLEVEVNSLTGDAQKEFVRMHKQGRQQLIDDMAQVPSRLLEFQKKVSEVEMCRAELARIESMIDANRSDADEAAQRLARYTAAYG
jgi:chromosome segregation ATPase